MFHKNTKKQMYGLSIVTTLITFIFFLSFIYFAYFTGKELLIHKVISEEEYAATSFDSYSYYECKKPNSWELKQYIISDEVKTSDKIIEIMYDDEQGGINPKQREQAMKTCLTFVIEQSSMKRNVDFQRSISKYVLAMIFFLVLFLSFAFQSERIYNKMK